MVDQTDANFTSLVRDVRDMLDRGEGQPTLAHLQAMDSMMRALSATVAELQAEVLRQARETGR